MAHGEVRVPAGRLVHLQFRRFAGCPICNLHVRTFARRHDEIRSAGIDEVVVFHSSLEELRSLHADLPFAILGDPTFALYRRYGVERSLQSLLHPRAMAAAVRGMFGAPFKPWIGSGGPLGLPADFLIDARGVVSAAKYGAHADDHWEIEDLLELAGVHGRAEATTAGGSTTVPSAQR